VKVLSVPDDYPLSNLTKALQGQDAVVSALPATDATLSNRIVDACIAAKVKRYIPSEFGNGTCEAAIEQVPLYIQKAEVARYLDEATRDRDGLTWSSIDCGQFFDWGLKEQWLDFDLEKKEVTIYDSGDKRWSTTCIGTVGIAVAKVLAKPLDDENVRNKKLLISSFTTSQNEVLKMLEDQDKAARKWTVKKMTSIEALEKAKTASDSDALKLRILVLLYADAKDNGTEFEKDVRWANELLGLEKEDLRSVIEKILSSQQD